MSYRLPKNTPEVLRAAGFTVIEMDGWRTRGRPGRHRPRGVMVHHTATSPQARDAVVAELLVRGRSDLPGPLSQIGFARDRTVYLIAAGRCNHAGRAKAFGVIPAGDGNELYVGIEAFHAGPSEEWDDYQYRGLVLLVAVLHDLLGTEATPGHKETSETGKIDPTFNMSMFRHRVAEARGHVVTVATLTADIKKLTVRIKRRRAAIKQAPKGSGPRRRLIAERDRMIKRRRNLRKKRRAARLRAWRGDY